MSRSVAEISASMIWPGVISMGMPRSATGVGGRGGELGPGREMREVSADSDTGEVGSDTGDTEDCGWLRGASVTYRGARH